MVELKARPGAMLKVCGEVLKVFNSFWVFNNHVENSVLKVENLLKTFFI